MSFLWLVAEKEERALKLNSACWLEYRGGHMPRNLSPEADESSCATVRKKIMLQSYTLRDLNSVSSLHEPRNIFFPGASR